MKEHTGRKTKDIVPNGKTAIYQVKGLIYVAIELTMEPKGKTLGSSRPFGCHYSRYRLPHRGEKKREGRKQHWSCSQASLNKNEPGGFAEPSSSKAREKMMDVRVESTL